MNSVFISARRSSTLLGSLLYVMVTLRLSTDVLSAQEVAIAARGPGREALAFRAMSSLEAIRSASGEDDGSVTHCVLSVASA